MPGQPVIGVASSVLFPALLFSGRDAGSEGVGRGGGREDAG